MRKEDYEYKVILSVNRKEWFVVQTISENDEFFMDSPYFENRFLCYKWIEDQERLNEQ